MITEVQGKWLAHLSNKDMVTIIPYDCAAPEKFKKIKEQIHELLGNKVCVEHHGASSLGISGQGELDIYVPVSVLEFDQFVSQLAIIFGKPGSLYPLERARFVSYVDGTKAEVFVINNQSQGWLDGIEFEAHLKSNPKLLKKYEILKEKASGLSIREYYRKKIEFINEVLANN